VDGILGGLCPALLISAVGQVIEVRLHFGIAVGTDTFLDVAVLLILCPQMDRYFVDRCGRIAFSGVGV
jgi:hypothetical protein